MTTERMALVAKLYRFGAAFQLAVMVIAFYYAITLDGTWQIVCALATGALAGTFTGTIIKAAALYTMWVMKNSIDQRTGQ